MENENRLDQTRLSKETGHGNPVEEHPSQTPPAARIQNPPEDFVRMREWIRQAQADTERARVNAQHAREDAEELKRELESQGRATKGAGWTAAILVLALIGTSIYGYYALQEHGAVLAQLPIVQKSLDSVGERMTAAEEKLRAWAADWEGMGQRVAKIEQSVRSNLQLAKNFAQEQAAKVHHQVQAELDNRTKAMEAKLAQFEASQQKDRVLLAELRRDLANVQREANQQIAQVKQETGRNLENVNGQVTQNRRDLDELNHQLDRRRLDFELSKEQTREVAPGITLTLSNMNVSYQRVQGRIHVISEGRILWVRGQGIQQPVIFYSQQDKRPYELVFTRVSKNSAVGYVLMPLWPHTGVPVADNALAVPSTAFVQ